MAKRDKLNPTNAEIISSQDVSDSIQYRDVQNRQQLQHSRIEEKKPLWPWRVLAIVLGVLSCLLMYVFTSLGFTVVGSFTASGNDAQYVANHEKTLMAQTSPATPDTTPGCYGAERGSVLNLPIYVRQVNSYMVANQHYEDRRTNPQCSAYMPADQATPGSKRRSRCGRGVCWPLFWVCSHVCLCMYSHRWGLRWWVRLPPQATMRSMLRIMRRHSWHKHRLQRPIRHRDAMVPSAVRC